MGNAFGIHHEATWQHLIALAHRHLHIHGAGSTGGAHGLAAHAGDQVVHFVVRSKAALQRDDGLAETGAVLVACISHRNLLEAAFMTGFVEGTGDQLSGVGNSERVDAANRDFHLGPAIVAVVEAQIRGLTEHGEFGNESHVLERVAEQAAHADGDAVLFQDRGSHDQVSAQRQEAALDESSGKDLRGQSAFAVRCAEPMQPATLDAAATRRLVPGGKIAGTNRVHVARQHQGRAFFHAVHDSHDVAELVGGYVIERQGVHLLHHHGRHLALVAAWAASPQQFLGECNHLALQSFELVLEQIVHGVLSCGPRIGWPV